MPRFIAAHTAPFTEDNLKALAKENLPKGVSWKVTYCDFPDNKFFCEWEAPDKATIENEFKVRNLPYDGIYPVQIFNVSSGKLE